MSILRLAAGALSGGPRVSFSGWSINASVPFVDRPAQAELDFNNDGTVGATASGDGPQSGQWIAPLSAAGAAYEIFATVNSGSFIGDSTGAWLSLGTSRGWRIQQNPVGFNAGSLSIAIRRASSGVTLHSADYSFTAEVF